MGMVAEGSVDWGWSTRDVRASLVKTVNKLLSSSRLLEFIVPSAFDVWPLSARDFPGSPVPFCPLVSMIFLVGVGLRVLGVAASFTHSHGLSLGHCASEGIFGAVREDNSSRWFAERIGVQLHATVRRGSISSEFDRLEKRAKRVFLVLPTSARNLQESRDKRITIKPRERSAKNRYDVSVRPIGAQFFRRYINNVTGRRNQLSLSV